MRRLLSTIAAILSLTAVAAAAEPTPPPAQTAGSNITVTECHAQLEKPQLRIGFTNTAKAIATEVDFQVTTPVGTIESIQDVGHFANGVAVTHNFAIPEGTSPLGFSSVRCEVTRVLYDDGTAWTNPSR